MLASPVLPGMPLNYVGTSSAQPMAKYLRDFSSAAYKIVPAPQNIAKSSHKSPPASATTCSTTFGKASQQSVQLSNALPASQVFCTAATDENITRSGSLRLPNLLHNFTTATAAVFGTHLRCKFILALNLHRRAQFLRHAMSQTIHTQYSVTLVSHQ